MKIQNIFGNFITFDNGSSMRNSYSYGYDGRGGTIDYFDFGILRLYENIKDLEFSEEIQDIIEIKRDGFNLVSKSGDKIFMPCYDDYDNCYIDTLVLSFAKRYKLSDFKSGT